jgi:alpha/beta superfamily hydrolase
MKAHPLSSPGFPGHSAPLYLAGPAGRIELLTSGPAPEKSVAATAVICHPHTLHGGTLRNKVVHTLARSFEERGGHTVRFNFRGAGASAGSYDHGGGETEDLLAVLDWVRAQRPHDVLWLAGFSFGAYVALRACARWPVAGLITVAPPVNLYDFTVLTSTPTPWIVIQGEQDEIVPAPAVVSWAQRLASVPDLMLVPGAGHFFHQRLGDLHAVVTRSLRRHFPPA